MTRGHNRPMICSNHPVGDRSDIGLGLVQDLASHSVFHLVNRRPTESATEEKNRKSLWITHCFVLSSPHQIFGSLCSVWKQLIFFFGNSIPLSKLLICHWGPYQHGHTTDSCKHFEPPTLMCHHLPVSSTSMENLVVHDVLRLQFCSTNQSV